VSVQSYQAVERKLRRFLFNDVLKDASTAIPSYVLPNPALAKFPVFVDDASAAHNHRLTIYRYTLINEAIRPSRIVC